MPYLLSVTVLWAFSFSLIGVYLAGQVDSWFAVMTRVLLSFLVFIPFLRTTNLNIRQIAQLMGMGAIQLGMMYGFYYHSFLYLTVPEVLLFTVMTPVYVTLFSDCLKRTLHPYFLLSAAIAVLGAVAIRYHALDSDFWLGLLLVQGANLCFAIGQVWYKHFMAAHSVPFSTSFAWFFFGAAIVASASFILFGDSDQLPTTTKQWGILIYLGIVASGLGYFAWNKGATLVDVGTLAVMNNLLIPAGIVVNVLIWNREADLGRLALGASIIVFALWLNHQLRRKHIAH